MRIEPGLRPDRRRQRKDRRDEGGKADADKPDASVRLSLEPGLRPGRDLAGGNQHHGQNEHQCCCRVVQRKDEAQHIADRDKLYDHSGRGDGDLPM